MMTIPAFDFFGRFFQLAYITTDLEQSFKLFEAEYGVNGFTVLPEPITVRVMQRDKVVSYTIKLAFGQVGVHQIELIEPVTDETGVYLPLLPEIGFKQVFHHLGCRFESREEWEAFRAGLDTKRHPIAFESLPGETNFLYLDEGEHLGHFVEYMWLG